MIGPMDRGLVRVSLEAVVVAVTDDRPRILTLPSGSGPASLPSGLLEVEVDATLELAMRRVIAEQVGLSVGYVEQLYTFGDRNRSRRRGRGEPRTLGVAYLVLTREATTPGRWIDWYHLFPWEDRRGGGRSDTVDTAVREWAGSDEDRSRRVRIAFGMSDTPWDGVRALERYELMYEAQLVPEWFVDHDQVVPEGLPGGEPMGWDHRRVAATALARLRGKITYRPVVFELLPETFTLSHLRRTVEALAGQRVHAQNFRRLVERGGLVEGTGSAVTTGGRPAELFRFRHEVLTERPRVGVGRP
jgi:hypothetical protein